MKTLATVNFTIGVLDNGKLSFSINNSGITICENAHKLEKEIGAGIRFWSNDRLNEQATKFGLGKDGETKESIMSKVDAPLWLRQWYIDFIGA